MTVNYRIYDKIRDLKREVRNERAKHALSNILNPNLQQSQQLGLQDNDNQLIYDFDQLDYDYDLMEDDFDFYEQPSDEDQESSSDDQNEDDEDLWEDQDSDEDDGDKKKLKNEGTDDE